MLKFGSPRVRNSPFGSVLALSILACQGTPIGTTTTTPPTGAFYPAPQVMMCSGYSAPRSDAAACAGTPGDRNMLISGNVLIPGRVIQGGQVLLDESGVIRCVGCDCGARAEAAAATRISCQGAVISPGLINAHEHLTFQGLPYRRGDERYEHRHEWRKPLNGHTRIGSRMATTENKAWAEIRMVMSGATSVNGSGGYGGFLRNVDSGTTQEGLGRPPVQYDTFPLGDSTPPLVDGHLHTPTETGGVWSGSCDAYAAGRTRASEVATEHAYTPHMSEGIDLAARNEFLCQHDGDHDLIQGNVAVIHGIGLLPPDIAELARDGSKLIWSPRSNITLYGDTARVTEYARLGVTIGIGSDWVFTGSMNMLRELHCADSMNARMGRFFSDEALWLMATRNNAAALNLSDAIGTLEEGKIGDIAIFDARTHPAHRAVLDAEPQDVILVLRSGVPLYGASELVAMLPTGSDCDELDVCGATRSVCVSRELASTTIGRTAGTLATLTAENTDQYPLFFCGQPDNEPSCTPARTEDRAAVMGSTRYSGELVSADQDGDGIADAEDLCPTVFSPIRPLDRGAQSDVDNDTIGDACDRCPLIANRDQADVNRDGVGDACPRE